MFMLVGIGAPFDDQFTITSAQVSPGGDAGSPALIGRQGGLTMQGAAGAPPSTIAGVLLKLSRARTHQKMVEEEIRSFLNDLRAQPSPLVTEVDPETGKKQWSIGRDLPTPPPALSPMIGDVLYNFRSALDHLVWQLVLANGETPGRNNAFLICDDPKRFEKAAPDRLRGVAQNAVDLIKSFQPCHTQHLYFGPSLLRLENLGNVDKHRHFNLLTAATAGGFWSRPLPLGAVDEVFIAEGPVKQGTVVASVPKQYADVGFSIVPDVAFDEAASGVEKSVEAVLEGIEDVVDHIVDKLRVLV